MKKFFFFLPLVLSVHIQAAPPEEVIYGEDNRMDVFESKSASLVELSRSTAAMIANANLRLRGAETLISGQTLKNRGVCAKERFSHQMAAASCSGFLVSDNILVTAGHCIKSMTECQNYQWVFDYKVESRDQVSISVPKSSVYSCKKIISRALDPLSKDDYAVIELDRSVNDRRPLTLRKDGRVSRGDSVAVIGHPSGLPTKITDDAQVRNLSSKFFVANLDTYGGNSGSAVFNTRTLEVEGILVRGETDYVSDAAEGCKVSYKCAENGCRGEDVTYITNVEALQNL